MAYTLIKNLTEVNYNKGGATKKYIVIHYTGNDTDTAAANANYFKSVNRSASAHYFVDASQVVQVVEDTDTAWAVGRNYGSGNLFGVITNSNSISIEMCSTNSSISEATYTNTVALTRTLMAQHGISAENVVRHYDVCSKQCPGWNGWIGESESIWSQFKSDIRDSGNVSPAPTPSNSAPTPIPSSKPEVYYAVQTLNHGRLKEVTGRTDFAGIANDAITAIKIRVSSGNVKYRVHANGKWFGWVTGCNWGDYNNGYAGDGKSSIDAIQIYYNTDVAKTGGKYYSAVYQVKPYNKNSYYPSIRDTDGQSGDGNGTAGTFGIPFTQILISLE